MTLDIYYLIELIIFLLGGLVVLAAVGLFIYSRRKAKDPTPAGATLLIAVILLGFGVFMQHGYGVVLSKIERNTQRLEANPQDVLARGDLTRLLAKFSGRPASRAMLSALAKGAAALGDTAEAQHFKDLAQH